MRTLRLFLAVSAIAAASMPPVMAATVDPAGDWHGKLDVGASGDLRIDIHVDGAPGHFNAVLTSPDQTPKPVHLDTFDVDQLAVHFTCRAIDATFSGAMTPDGKSITGSFIQRHSSLPLTLLRGRDTTPTGTVLTAKQASMVVGTWAGVANFAKPSRLRLHIERLADGRYASTIDNVTVGASGIPSNFSIDGRTVEVRIPSIGALYQGTISVSGKAIAGTFTQRDQDYPLTFRKTR